MRDYRNGSPCPSGRVPDQSGHEESLPVGQSAGMVPDAAGVRLRWDQLPKQVRRSVEETLHDEVVMAMSQPGGFSPGTADRITTGRGHRAFVKAVCSALNPDTPHLHRREARVLAALPAWVLAPRLLASFDDGDWVTLVVEDVAGPQPRLPWQRAELDRVLSTLADLAQLPCPVSDLPQASDELAEDFAGWQRLAAEPTPALAPWAAKRLPLLDDLAAAGRQALIGTTLALTDLRADNILLPRAGRAVLVDWPWACQAPPWLDTLQLLVNVRLYRGHDVDALLQAHTSVSEQDATAVLAGFCGYFLDQARRPASPGLPTVRAFQQAQGDAVLDWLRERLPHN